MASRSSTSTHSPATSMGSPSVRSRQEMPSGNGQGAKPEPERRVRGPSEKKHKNLAEVRSTGRQSDQG